jgi:hypothetical protein
MVLRAAGAVEFRGGKLMVMNWDELVQIAEFDPSYLHLHQELMTYEPHWYNEVNKGRTLLKMTAGINRCNEKENRSS